MSKLGHSLMVGLFITCSGCACSSRTKDKTVGVLEIQNRILKNILDSRSTADFRRRVDAIPAVAKQEDILAQALQGVIKSQETVIRINRKANSAGVMDGK